MDFTVRPWKASDAAVIVPYANDLAVAKNLRDAFPHPYTLTDAECYVNSCVELEGHGQLCRAIVVSGEAVGSIGLFPGNDVYCRSAELGYWLGRPFWRQGIMTAAVREICREGFQALDIVRIYAEPYAQNAGSRRVLEKVGFTLEGILRSSVYKPLGRPPERCLLDSCVYGLLREEAAL